MDLLQLRYFYESAENENFSHTAKQHTVPASTVSASVRRLEEELACKLFDREGNRIRLNENGKKLLTSLKIAFGSLDKTVDELHNKSDELSGEIHLLVRTDRAIINQAVCEFQKINSSVIFHISHAFDINFAAKYDLIIDESGEKYPGYKTIPFISESLRFAAAANNKIVNQPISLCSLSEEKFITLSNASPLYKQLDFICKTAGFNPYVNIECDDPLYLRRYVANGLGITLIPEKSWKNEINDDIVFLNVSDFHAERQNCIYKKDGFSGKVVDTFCNFLLKLKV